METKEHLLLEKNNISTQRYDDGIDFVALWHKIFYNVLIQRKQHMCSLRRVYRLYLSDIYRSIYLSSYSKQPNLMTHHQVSQNTKYSHIKGIWRRIFLGMKIIWRWKLFGDVWLVAFFSLYLFDTIRIKIIQQKLFTAFLV